MLVMRVSVTTFMNLVFQRLLRDTYPGKESTVIEEGSNRIGNTLWCSFGKCRPWLLVQKVFAA